MFCILHGVPKEVHRLERRHKGETGVIWRSIGNTVKTSNTRKLPSRKTFFHVQVGGYLSLQS